MMARSAFPKRKTPSRRLRAKEENSMKRFIVAVAVLSTLGATAASAQPDYRNDRQDRREAQRDARPNGDRDRDGIPNRYDAQPNRYNYGGRTYDRFRGPVYNHPRGFTYRSWVRGQTLPRAYFGRPYYVDNWS